MSEKMIEVQIWDGLNIDFTIAIMPHENGSHEYTYHYQDEDNYVTGEGKIFSIHPVKVYKLLFQIINSVREKLE